MTSSMSSRERMLAAMTRQEPDHVPFSPYINQMSLREAPLQWGNQLQRAEVMLDLGLDPTIDLWLPYPQPAPEVEIRTWRDTSGPVPLLTKEYHTPAGVLRQTVKETDKWTDPANGAWIPTTLGIERRDNCNMEMLNDWNISRRTETWVNGPEDLEAMRYLMHVPAGWVLDEWRMDAERALEFARQHDLLTVARRTIVGDAFQWMCDIEQFLIWMIEAPEFVTEFLAIWQEWSLAMTELSLDVGVDAVQRRGWYEIPAYWGVKYFQKYLVPLIDEESRMVHEAGKQHVYLLPEGHGAFASPLNQLEADCLMGVDPRMLHGGDLRSLFEATGETKSYWGGVDAEVTLISGDPVAIEKAVKTAIEDLGGNGGLILGSFTWPQIGTEQILMMLEAWKKYRGMHSGASA